MGKCCLDYSDFFFKQISIKLADNKDSYKISRHIRFWPNFGYVQERYTTLRAPQTSEITIHFWSNDSSLPLTSTTIKTWTSSIQGQMDYSYERYLQFSLPWRKGDNVVRTIATSIFIKLADNKNMLKPRPFSILAHFRLLALELPNFEFS